MKKILLCLFTLGCVLQSCKYKSFAKYYIVSGKTHQPHFTKWEKFTGSNSNPLRSAYDVTCYDWSVQVQPDKKAIKASMRIYFRMKARQDTVMLDLNKHMKIEDLSCSVPLKKWKRKKDVLFFVFDKVQPADQEVCIEIRYHGQPVSVAGYSSIYWRKDKQNNPWICTSTQGIGPEHMLPCKMLLYDEPDSCFIRVEVPKGLFAVANGKFMGMRDTPNGTIFNWAVKNPINIYNISFNVGDYVKLEKNYRDINGINRNIDVYALSYNRTVADTFYDQAPVMMGHFENLFGAYPWWNDGCKFIESNLVGSAMEHQSGISMGNSYYYDNKRMNTTLAHELGHEWWGNNITGFDYADLWLHEGFATYCEFLIAEAIYGQQDYNGFVRYYALHPKNRRPVLKTTDVLYNSFVHSDDQDIYPKGAMLLHTLRRQLDNDELFFKTLKNFQVDFAKTNVTTHQFINYFNTQTHTNFTPYFDMYLRETKPPILEFSVTEADSVHSVLKYRWRNKLPENFSMKIPLDFKTTGLVIYPSREWQQINIPAKQAVVFDRARFGYILAEQVKP